MAAPPFIIFLLRVFFLANKNKRGTLGILPCGVVTDDLAKLLIRERNGASLSENVAREVVCVDDHGANARFFKDLVANAGGVFGDADAVFAVNGKYVGVKSVKTRHFHADHLIEDAAPSDKLSKSGADRRPENLRRAALVDGKLHLAHLANADAGAVVLDGKAAQKLCKRADLHVLAVHDALLTKSDDLFADAALRNEQFFSLAELNAAIRKKLTVYNARKFEKKECSRLSLFLGEEMPLLAPLPATPFELCEWKQATVQFNYHIAVDRMYYSVPYQYIRNKVDVRITEQTIEIFYNHNRIASHKRLIGRPGQYSTITEHMPEDHQKYLEWNGDRFRKWADSIGINTRKVVDAILTSGRVEQQSYRSCMGLLKLSEKHSPAKLEAVCAKALTFSSSPSYKSIKNLLVSFKEQDAGSKSDTDSTTNRPRGITRGARYYGGKN